MNENSFSLSYARQVLGINSYLCPEKIFKKRSLKKGSNSSLVVLFEPLKEEDRTLLKRILGSIQIFKPSILEVKEDKEEFFKNLALYMKNLKTPVIVFKDKNLKLKSPFLLAPALKFLRGNEKDSKEKKLKLWQLLQTWKKGDFK